MELNDKKILLGVCGGIAAYKACDLVRRLAERGAKVHVVMTQAAQQFITPLTFQSLSRKPVHTDLFSLTEESEMGHIQLADHADLVLIAPATADFLAKAALGLADDLLSTLLLVTQAPIVFAPAMNVHMWEKPVVQGHVQTLKNRGCSFVEPEEGFLACGWEGKGRLAETETIFNAIGNILPGLRPFSKKKSLVGKKVLITAGPTREYIDPVRFISNPSSGKMGFALAAEATQRGAKVVLISGPASLPTPPNVKRIDVESAEEMLKACESEFPETDIFIATAAVGDFKPANHYSQKIKKIGKKLLLELNENIDVLKTISKRKKKGQFLVGFAAETEDLQKNAKKKLHEKKLNLIVANNIKDAAVGFSSDQNKVLLINKKEVLSLPTLPKIEVAKRILDYISKVIATRP